MARQFTAANSESFQTLSALVTGYPWSFSCWAYFDDLSADERACFTITDRASNFNNWRVTVLTDGHLQLRTHGGGGFTNADTTNTISTGAWVHIGIIAASATSKQAILNGDLTGDDTDTTSNTPSGTIDTTSVGRADMASNFDFMDGRLAEMALWDVALTESEMVGLANGAKILSARPAGRVGHWPGLEASGDLIDYSGNGNDLTDGNTVTSGDHAPVSPMFGMDMGWQGAFTEAAVGGLSIPVAMHSYRRHHQAGI